MEELIDFNDALDNVDRIEERFRQNGFNDGFREGHEAGKEEGFKHGSEQGARVGLELGFYTGFVSTWMKLISEEPSKSQLSLSEKTMISIERLSKLLESFSLNDHRSLDEHDLNNLRAKFKEVTLLLNMSTDNSLSKLLSF